MKLTKPQVQMFWRLWSAACRAQGWDRAHGVPPEVVDERRKDLLACYGFGSLHDVDRTAGFDAVKAALLALQDNIDGAVEVDHPEIGHRRRIERHLTHVIVPALGAGGWQYLAAIAVDRHFPMPLDLSTLSVDQLDQLLVTATKRLRARPSAQSFSQ